MKIQTGNDYLLRDSILKLLSDDEIARVSTAETAERLPSGEEYLDLEQLEKGVRRAPGETPLMGRLLSKSSVHDKTWHVILEMLSRPPAHH